MLDPDQVTVRPHVRFGELTPEEQSVVRWWLKLDLVVEHNSANLHAPWYRNSDPHLHPRSRLCYRLKPCPPPTT